MNQKTVTCWSNLAFYLPLQWEKTLPIGLSILAYSIEICVLLCSFRKLQLYFCGEIVMLLEKNEV